MKCKKCDREVSEKATFCMYCGNRLIDTGRPENDVEILTLQLMLEAVKEALKRSRFAFLVSTVISLAILITTYNAYVSWYRFLPIELAKFAAVESSTNSPNQSGDAPKPSPDTQKDLQPVGEAQKQLLTEWVKSTTISEGLLGISVGVSDLAVLGALTLFIVSVWFYFSVRRENRTIGFLLKHSRNEKAEIRNMIFHGIISHLVFADIGRGDHPIDHLEGEVSRARGRPFTRLIVKMLFFLPPFAVAIVVLMDILSLVLLKAPYRLPHEPLWKHLTVLDWVQVSIMELVAIFFATLTGVICTRILEFENATDRVLMEYAEKLDEPED
jgi:hypothetical protein